MHPFTVVGDPVRRRIVEVLAGGERTAGEVVDVVGGEFGISQSAVSQQLKVLREHGFARVRPEGARRIYALDPRAVAAMDEWLHAVGTFWADRLDDLAAEVEGHATAPAAAPATAPAIAAGAPVIALDRLASVTRTVCDIAESVAFYGEALGLSRLSASRTVASFDAGGTRLLLVRRDPPFSNESLLAFAVRDLRATVERLQRAGVAFRGRSPSDHAATAGESAVYFDDPEGRPLALVAPRS
jgi:DNA-binding transcriptional ArsR family regulator/catechol 2,3-dioxygenase-like lactoylglutathione lyase family enzyme